VLLLPVVLIALLLLAGAAVAFASLRSCSRQLKQYDPSRSQEILAAFSPSHQSGSCSRCVQAELTPMFAASSLCLASHAATLSLWMVGDIAATAKQQ
jgi:hypothetical protein